MDTPTGGGRDSRFNMGYNMSLLSGDAQTDIYGNTGHSRPSTSLPSVPRPSMTLPGSCGAAGIQRGLKRTSSDVCFDQEVSGTRPTMLAQSGMGMTGADCTDIGDDGFSQTQKKTPPPNGKKTKGRVKIKMEYIDNKLRRYTTFSKRKTGIMKKAYELSTLTGTQVMLLVASETGHVYTFATRKLQPMITSEAGKALIQTCLNSPDPTPSGGIGDQRMSATGFEETELTYNIGDEEQKEAGGMSPRSDVGGDTGDSSGNESPGMPDEIGNHLRGNMSNDSNDSSSPPPELKYSPGGLTQSHLLAAGSYPGGLMYQSPQGMVFHGATSGLPNGLVFSVAPHAQTHTLHLQQDKGAVGSQSSRSQQQQFITIPFPIAMSAANGHHSDAQAADLTKTRK